jgi:hypothetical protein
MMVRKVLVKTSRGLERAGAAVVTNGHTVLIALDPALDMSKRQALASELLTTEEYAQIRWDSAGE